MRKKSCSIRNRQESIVIQHIELQSHGACEEKLGNGLKLNEPNVHDNLQIMREALEERVADIARFSRGSLVVSNNKLGRNEKLKKLGGRRNFPRRSVFNWDWAID
jgi:hypothetical protein